MNISIQEKDGFRLVGYKERVSTLDGYNFQRVPEIWHESMTNGTQDLIMKTATETEGVMGVCANFADDSFDYYIAAKSTNEVPEGLSELHIEKGMWAVFTCAGIDALQPTWNYIYEEWLPTSEYKHDGRPEIEWYPEGDPHAQNYLCEIWIPVTNHV